MLNKNIKNKEDIMSLASIYLNIPKNELEKALEDLIELNLVDPNTLAPVEFNNLNDLERILTLIEKN